MMWLKLNPDGTPSVEGKTKPYCYHIDQFAELQPLIHKVMEYGKAMGLDMIQGDHEDAPGQLELNWQFDRAELTADRLTTYRQICRQVGREFGAFPCFMPKPFMGVSANGCHHNISLWQGEENVFLPDTDNPRMPSKLGLNAIGGILEHLGALTCITAPTVNSYRRFWDTGFWAPLFADWGFQNRTTALRVSAPGRFEYRSVDSAVNPYLSFAAMIKAMQRRHPAQPGPGAAGGPQHLRGHRGRQERQAGPDDAGRRAGGAGEGRGGPGRAAGRDVHGVPPLQDRRVGALLRDGLRLGRRGVPGHPAVAGHARRERGSATCAASQASSTGTGPGDIGSEMTRMLQSMKHRGPDSSGFALYGPPDRPARHAGQAGRPERGPRTSAGPTGWSGTATRWRHRLAKIGATIDVLHGDQDYAYRVTFRYSGDLKPLADYVEDVPGCEVLSLGHSLEIIKDLSDAESVAERYKLAGFTGTHAIGHVRMATESDVDISGAHPYWAYPFSDIAVVHNGQLTNYHMWRRRLERHGPPVPVRVRLRDHRRLPGAEDGRRAVAGDRDEAEPATSWTASSPTWW